MKIPEKEYIGILKKMPILCVDLVIFNKQNKKILLVQRNNTPLKNVWWVPGGRVKKGEDALSAVKRKAKEECELSLTNITFLGYYEDKIKDYKNGFFRHTVSLVFVGCVKKSYKIKLDSQSSAWKWGDKLPKRFKLKHGSLC